MATKSPARPQPKVDTKRRPGAAPGSLNAEWNGLPIWGWTAIGVVTAAGAYLFIRRWRSAKAAGQGDTATTSLSPFGSSASWGGGPGGGAGPWGGGSLPVTPGGIGLPAGTTTTTTPSGAGVNNVPAASPSTTYQQPPTVSVGLPAWGGPGGPLKETQAPGVASAVYSGDVGGWVPLVAKGPSGFGGQAYGPDPSYVPPQGWFNAVTNPGGVLNLGLASAKAPN